MNNRMKGIFVLAKGESEKEYGSKQQRQELCKGKEEIIERSRYLFKVSYLAIRTYYKNFALHLFIKFPTIV